MVDPVKVNEAEEAQDESYDTSDKEAVNKVRKKAARTRADRLQFVAAAMDTEQGRSWFYDLLLFCKVFRTPFDEDPYSTAFKCGEQTIGLRVLDDIQTANPDKYITMITENKSKNG